MAQSAQSIAAAARVATPDTNGAAMRRVRELVGISLKDMADRIGTSSPHLSNVESGRRGISWPLLRKYAAECDTELDVFLNRPRVGEAA